MNNSFATQEEVVALLKSGKWELGYGEGSRSDGRYWLQEGGLMRGGKSQKVRANTVYALIRKRLISAETRRKGDPFWLRRYQLEQQVQRLEQKR